MASIFEKLNLKGQREILVVNAPASFEAELAYLKNITILRDPNDAKARKDGVEVIQQKLVRDAG